MARRLHSCVQVTSQLDISTRLTAMFLRWTTDTTACRAFARLGVDQMPPELGLTTLAAALGIPSPEIGPAITRARKRAERALNEAAAYGADLVGGGDAAFPSRLRTIADPPLVLWMQGVAMMAGPTVAIVGSRAASPAGLVVARELSRDLARRGYTIVSGLATGVDGAAHQAALDAGGLTVAVLGTGLDVTYPAHHRGLQASIGKRGCLMSEFPLGVRPRGWHFPLRNRIIAGLAQAVVVIEASAQSGSLITARMALEQGRDVMAVPGTVVSGRSKGCHALIRDGARLVETVADVVEELEGVGAGTPAADAGKPLFRSYLESVMDRAERYSLDDLAARTGRPAAEILSDLAQLEIEGRVRRVAGGCFLRV